MTRPGPLTEERKATHGEWRETAAIAASLKRVLRDEGGRGFALLEDRQAEALDMICAKIARILSGDPWHADHWLDICGYSTLALDSAIDSLVARKGDAA